MYVSIKRLCIYASALCLFATALRAQEPSGDLTVGHQILALEKEVTGRDHQVEFDLILNKLAHKIEASDLGSIVKEEERVLAHFRLIANTLFENKFHFVGTYPLNLSEVFEGNNRYFDCDTGSFLYVSVGEKLGLPISMVEIQIPFFGENAPFDDHNFVRWTLEDGSFIDWDVNKEYVRGKTRETNVYGFSWTQDQLMGYVHYIRGISWAKQGEYIKALEDYETSIALFPRWMKARNNLSWMLSTKEQVQHLGRQKDALKLAKRIIQKDPTSSYLDTYACACAINGDFKKAIKYQKKALKLDDDDSYRRRLMLFEQGKDCLGEE